MKYGLILMMPQMSYINFKRPIVADDSEMMEDDTIVRYHEGQVVGITILNASTR